MVKRVAAFVLFSILIPVLAIAQTAGSSTKNVQAAGDVAAGVKLGFNVANLIENTEKLDSKTGVILGGFVRRAINESLAIQGEALFSQQGASERSSTVALSYLQIPVLGVFSFHQSSSTPFVFAGPALGFELSANLKENGHSTDVSDSGTSDFSFVVGGGVEVNKFIVEARYVVGLKDIDTGNDISKNRVFSIIAGYRFR